MVLPHGPRTGTAAPSAASSPWGDGFARDGLRELCAVRDWSSCAPDEYILLFPRLLPKAGGLPQALRTHLETCVGVRAWRLARLDGCSAPPPLRARLPGLENAATLHRGWFADADAVTCLLRRIGLLHVAPERLAHERGLLTFLDGVLAEVQAGRSPAWDMSAEARLAFGAGFHPAYLWPEAAVSPERGIVAGWLGHLDRGRAALMPPVVADYVLDVFGDGAGSDPQLAALAGGVASLDVLRRAARRCRSGEDIPARFTPRATWPSRVSTSRTGITAGADA